MALYTERTYEDLLNDELRQQKLKQAQALATYNAQKKATDQKYSDNGGLSGFLGQIAGGIGKFVGDIGTGVGGLIGTGIASAKDILEGKAATQENTLAFKRDWYKADNDKDAAAKAAGTSLNAAANLASFIPGVGAGTAAGKAAGSVGANAAMGALGGFGDEFQQQGADADLASATNRAIAGGAAGLATGGLNRKLGNATSKVGSALLNNKVATSTLGRGALSGAVGGAVGGGTSAALGGGDVAQAALTGGLTGAAGGTTQAGLMSAAGKIGNKTRDIIWDKGKTTATQNDVSNVISDNAKDELPDYTKPKDWSGKELKLEKKGIVGGIGEKLENASKRIKDQDVYNSLYSKTAEKVISNNSIEKLRSLGFEPKDYGDAAKVSTAVNKFFDDVVGNSKASIIDNDLVTRLANPDTIFQTEALQKAYINDVNNLMSKLEKGSVPGSYSVKDLLDESRAFSKKAATQYRKGIDVNGNDIGNGRSDLGDAYMNVSKELRSLADAGMDGLGDNYTRSQLTKMLQNMGAPEKTIEYFSNFENLGDGIRKTSLLEDARQMNSEMAKSKIRRNATAGNSKNILNRIADKTGVADLVDVVAEPIGRITGTVAQKAGQGLQSADRAIQNIASNTQPLSQNTQNMLGNIIGRTSGQMAASNNVQNARRTADYQNLEDLLTNAQALGAVYDPTTGSLTASTAQSGMTNGLGAQTRATSQTEAQLANIASAMNLALSAGDLTSYSKLADLYQQAYKIYQLQNPQTTNDLTTSEKNQLAKLQSANTALDQLEELYNKAGGGQGVIAGNVANFLGGLGLNSDVSTYNQLAQGLINQIGAAIGKTDSLNTEGEVQRALSLVPKITDDAQTAKNKLATLRSLLQTNTGTYNQLYGA